MRRSVQVSVASILAAVLASCGGTSVPTAVPAAASANPPAAPASSSPTPSPSPLATPAPAATPAPVAIATATPGKPRSSAGAHPSASPDAAALVETYSAYFSATIGLLDLADDDFAVSVTFIDPDSSQTQALGTYTLASSGQESDAVPPGTYRLDFRQPSGGTTGPTCTITVKKGDAYTFVAVPGAIAVSRTGYRPTRAADLFVPTSLLCRT